MVVSIVENPSGPHDMFCVFRGPCLKPHKKMMGFISNVPILTFERYHGRIDPSNSFELQGSWQLLLQPGKGQDPKSPLAQRGEIREIEELIEFKQII